MPFDSILFDFDGVLVDSEPIHYDCWIDTLRPFGFNMDWNTYSATCIGISDRTMIERFAASQSPALDADLLYAQYPIKKQLFRDRIFAANPFPQPTLDLIRELQHIPKAVVSSSGRTEVEPPLIHAGIRNHFEVLICGLEAGKLKPAPDPYLKAAQLLNATNPLVIEDSDAGVAAGQAAGFQVLRIAHPSDLAQALRRLLP